ncbi:reverse transcriptase domain-containing protein [Tanacetum coccineum]
MPYLHEVVYDPPVNLNDQQNKYETPINFDSDDEDDELIPQPKSKTPKPVKETPIPKPYKPKIHILNASEKKKWKLSMEDMIRAVRINVSLIDVLAAMPNYGKFLKELVNNKHKIEQISASFLSDKSSAILQNKVPPKLGDPGGFLIPSNFNKAFSCNDLADLGANINIMPYSLYAKLSLETLKPTKISVRLADRSFQYPVGIAKNMLIEVGKFTFPADFVILKMEEDSKVPLILGRPFLHTADAVIRVKQKQLNLGVRTQRMIFNIDSVMKHFYSNDDTCFSIYVINKILEDFDALLNEGSEILHSIEGTILKEKLFAEFHEFIAMTADENSESEFDTEEPPFEKSPLKPITRSKHLLKNLLRILNLNLFLITWNMYSWKNPLFYLFMLAIFHDMIKESIEVFMDDISVFGSFFDHCLNNLDKMLQRLEFDKAKINVNSKLPPPTNIKEFDIEIKDIKGIENLTADHLSRIENEETSDDSEVNDNFPRETLMEINTQEEPWFAEFANYLVSDIIPKGMTYQQKNKFFSDLKHYFWEEPYLFKVCFDAMIRRCVSGPETKTILDKHHYGPTSGHYGPNTTAKKVLDSGFYWPTIIKEAHTQVRLCEACQKTGNILKRDKMPLNNIQVCEIFDIWGINFIGPFPKSYKFEYILVVIDYVYKWAEAQALPINDARVVITFLKKVLCRFGMPKALISDRGTHLCKKIIEKTMKRYGVNHRFSTSYRPQTSGQVENTNKALKRVLEKTVKDNPTIWSRKLDDALWAFRTAYKTPTGTTPYKLIYGKNCHMLFEIEHCAYWAQKNCNPDLIATGEKRMFQLHKLDELQHQSYENSRLYKPKLRSRWLGPYIVKHQYPSGYVELYGKDEKTFIVNGHRLKLYHEEDYNDQREALTPFFPKE